MKKTTLKHVALGFLLRAANLSTTWRLTCFLCDAVQALGDDLARVLPGKAQG